MSIDGFGDLAGAGIDGYGDIAVPGLGGPQGPAGEIISATAETLPSGQEATVALGGTPSQRTIRFGLPRGEQGIQGPEGDVTPDALAAQTAAESARDAAQTAQIAAEAARAQAESAADGAAASAQIFPPSLATFFRQGDERCYVAYTVDGKNFDELGSYATADAGATVRDPSPLIVGSRLYVAHTRPTTAGGGAFGVTDTIGLMYTDDLTTWTNVSPINIATKISGVKQTWAPEWFVDGNTTYLLFAASTIMSSDNSPFQMYEIHTTDTNLATASWSAATKLAGLPAGIDGHIVKLAADQYVIFYSDANQYLRRAQAPAVAGPWTDDRRVDDTWGKAEGPTTVQMPGGTRRLYMDRTAWTTLTSESEFYVDFSEDLSSHGGMVKLALPMMHMGIAPVDNIASGGALLAHGSRPRASGTLLCSGNVAVPASDESVFAAITGFDVWRGFGGLVRSGSQIKVPFAGVYTVSASVALASMAGNWAEVAVYVSGQQIHPFAGSCRSGDSDDFQTVTIPPVTVWCVPNDLIELRIRGNAPAAKMREVRSGMTVTAV